MKALNLSKFKKVSSDDEKTVFRHEDGHCLHVAHKGLSSGHKKQIKDLPEFAEGGEAEKPWYSKAYDTVNNALSSQDEIDADAKRAEGKAAEDHLMQNPGPSVSLSMAPKPDNSGVAPDDYQQERPNGFTRNSGLISDKDQAAINSIKEQEGPVSGDNELGATQDRQPSDVSAPPSEQPPMSGTDTVPPEGEQSSVPTLAQTAPQGAAQQAPDYQHSFQDYKAAHQQEFAQQDAAFQQDLQNGHITPETYHDLYAKKSTLGKIGMLFGMLLSGIGSGMTHQPNALLGAMDNEIKNDLEAQRQSRENAQNFIKINQQGYMNKANIRQLVSQGQLTEAQAKGVMAEADTKAFTLSQLQANRAALHDQALIVQKMPEGPQKEQAKQALAMMGTAVTNENARLSDIAASKMALMNQLGGGGNTTALRLMGMDKMADDIEKKTIPGIGKAQIPVPQETRDSIAAQKQYDEKAHEYVDFAKQHASNWSNMNLADRQRVSNQGAAMAANLQSLYRNKIKGGVYKKGEQEFIEQIIPDQPAKWSASLNAIPKVEQTIRDNRNDIKNTAGSVGLDYSGPSTKGGAKEGAASTSKSGKPIVFSNGKWIYK